MADFSALASNFAQGTALGSMTAGNVAMLCLACALVYFSARKSLQPALLIPLGFGVILANSPITGGEELYGKFALAEYLYVGLLSGFYPALLLLGVGASIDFAPMLANPRLMVVGLAAPVGVFAALILNSALGLETGLAASLAPAGGADLPSTLFLAAKLSPATLGQAAVGAGAAISLYPLVAPTLLKLLTSKEERLTRMTAARRPTRFELLAFPLAGFLVIALLAPLFAGLAGFFFLGNLLRESGVTERISNTARSIVVDLSTVVIGLIVGITLHADAFFSRETACAAVFGLIGLAVAIACGTLFARALNAASTDKVNPLVGGAAVAAPEAGRIPQMLAAREDPTNYLLAHSNGVAAAAIVGTLFASGILLSLFGI